MSPTSRATWLNPTNLARGAMPLLSAAPSPVATGRKASALTPLQGRVGHGLQAVGVVGLEPLQHHPLHAGLVQASELLDDLRRGPDEDTPVPEIVGRFPGELALHVGVGAAEDDARHQRPAYL